MKKILLGLLVLLLFALLFVYVKFGQNGSHNRSIPVALADTLPVNVPVSTFNIPIHYSHRQLEHFLNGTIRDKFLETTIVPAKNKKDSIRVELTKFKKIRIAASGNQLVVVFPVRVKGTIMHSRINFLTKGMEPLETNYCLNCVLLFSLTKTGDW